MNYKIRPAVDQDRNAVDHIFEYFMNNTFSAYPEVMYEGGLYNILRQNYPNYPMYVAEDISGKVVGVAMLRFYHPSPTLKRTGELTYFILPEHTGHKLGEQFLNILTSDARDRGMDNLMGSISSLNEQSLGFHKKHGFVEVGRFRNAGRKFGKDFDVVWVQKFIGEE